MALFFSAATLAGAFGGILARGIAEMSGVGGKSAWAWIFILEGLLSILVSFTAYWAINDYPATLVPPLTFDIPSNSILLEPSFSALQSELRWNAVLPLIMAS